MSEDANNEQEHSLGGTDPVASMTRWEKFEFWFFPAVWALCWGFLFLISASFLIAFAASLLIHFQKIIHNPEWLKNIGPSMALLAGMLIVSGAVLVYPVSVFRQMARRKKESGSIYLCGEELIARRYRSEHPAIWLRIAIVLFFSLIAFGVTHSLWVSPDRRVLTDWIWPALLWLVAIMVAVEAISPRPGRQWTGFVASSALGLEAILAVVAILRHSKHTASGWGFALLMALFFVAFAIATVQEGKKKMRPSSPEASTPAATP